MTRTVQPLRPQAVSLAVLRDKYLQPGESTAEDLFARVARALASVEAPEARAVWERRFLQHLQAGGLGAGRIMASAGTDADATLINCFVQPLGDCLQGRDAQGWPGLELALREATHTLRMGGGVGCDVSSVRPRAARPEPGETQAQVCAELEALVAELQSHLPDLQIAPLEIEDWDEALDTSPAAPLVQSAVNAVRTVQGHGEITGAPWGSDAPIIAAAGIPCVVMGPGAVAEEGHTIHESIALDRFRLFVPGQKITVKPRTH